jgi:hypothetical protein
MDLRIKHTSDLCSYSVDTQSNKSPSGIDLVPFDHGSSAQSETIDGTHTDGASARVSLGIRMQGNVPDLESIIVDICSFQVAQHG